MKQRSVRFALPYACPPRRRFLTAVGRVIQIVRFSFHSAQFSNSKAIPQKKSRLQYVFLDFFGIFDYNPRSYGEELEQN